MFRKIRILLTLNTMGRIIKKERPMNSEIFYQSKKGWFFDPWKKIFIGKEIYGGGGAWIGEKFKARRKATNPDRVPEFKNYFYPTK